MGLKKAMLQMQKVALLFKVEWAFLRNATELNAEAACCLVTSFVLKLLSDVTCAGAASGLLPSNGLFTFSTLIYLRGKKSFKVW